MEINVLEESKNKLKIELKDETHTLCNAIRNELWHHKNVEISGYNISHPLVSSPIITVITNDGKSRKTLLDVVLNLQKKNKELKELIKKLK